MTDTQPTTPEERAEWKQLCEMKQPGKASVLIAWAAMPRLLKDVERLRSELDRMNTSLRTAIGIPPENQRHVDTVPAVQGTLFDNAKTIARLQKANGDLACKLEVTTADRDRLLGIHEAASAAAKGEKP